MFFFCLIFFSLIVRLYCVQIVDHEDQLRIRDGQARGTIEVDTPPGPIYDKDHQILALSRPVEAVWVNPSVIEDKPAAAKALSPVLGMTEALVMDHLNFPRSKYRIVKHKLSTEQAAGVRRLMDTPLFKRG